MNKIRIFVGHVFDRSLIDDLRETLAQSFSQFGKGVELWYADDHLSDSHILAKVCHAIEESKCCVFELSDTSRPNVFIELGFALGREKPIVMLIRKGARCASDIAGHDFLEYESYKELREKLIRRAPQIIGWAANQLIREGSHVPIDRLLILGFKNLKEGDEVDVAAMIRPIIGRTPNQGEINGHTSMLRRLEWIEQSSGKFVLTSKGERILAGAVVAVEQSNPNECPQILVPVR